MRTRLFFETRLSAVDQSDPDFIFQPSLAAASDTVDHQKLCTEPQSHPRFRRNEIPRSRDICHHGDARTHFQSPEIGFVPQKSPALPAHPRLQKRIPICHSPLTPHQRPHQQTVHKTRENAQTGVRFFPSFVPQNRCHPDTFANARNPATSRGNSRSMQRNAQARASPSSAPPLNSNKKQPLTKKWLRF